MIRIGDLKLIEGRLFVAVSFTDADQPAEVAEAKAAGVSIAELRIDLFRRHEPDYVRSVVESLVGLPRIATIRWAAESGGWTGDEPDRAALYEAVLPLVEAVDVELAAAQTLARIQPLARSLGKTLIVSHHDFERTPPFEELAGIARRAAAAGADIVKIAAKADSDGDVETLGRLLDERPAPHMVVIGMGEHGATTRLLFPGRGSLFTFAAKGDRVSAPGQLDYRTTLKLAKSLYPAS